MSVVANIFFWPPSGPPYAVGPYGDTTGWFVHVPVMLTTARGGGPAGPTGVTMPPTWTLNGVPLSGGNVPTLLFFNPGYSAFWFQLAEQLQPTDVLTMSAPSGWASVSGGTVGGTSGGGSGSSPITIQNNSGRSIEVALSLPAGQASFLSTPTMKLGSSKETIGVGGFGISANLAKLGQKWFNVYTYDANGYPATINSAAAMDILDSGSVANGIDGSSFPGDGLGIGTSNGIFAATYDDITTGVNSSPASKKLTVTLRCLTSGFTVSALSPLSAGTWDGTAWRGISNQVTVTKGSGAASSNAQIQVLVSSTALNGSNQGVVGLENLIVTGPGANGIPATPYTSITQVDDQLLRMAKLDYSSRFIEGGGQCGFVDSNLTVPADLALRSIGKSMWNSTQAIYNISKIAPVSFPLTITSPQYGTLTWATLVDMTDGLGLIAQYTTAAPHGLTTGNLVTFSNPWQATAPYPVLDQTSTPAWSLVGSIGSTDTTMTISPTTSLTYFTGANGYCLQIDSEQITIASWSSGVATILARGAHGTAAAAHSSGASVFGCPTPANSIVFAMVVDSSNLVLTGEYIPFLTGTGTANVSQTQTYSSPYPQLNTNFPLAGGTPYEMITSLCATCRGQRRTHDVRPALDPAHRRLRHGAGQHADRPLRELKTEILFRPGQRTLEFRRGRRALACRGLRGRAQPVRRSDRKHVRLSERRRILRRASDPDHDGGESCNGRGRFFGIECARLLRLGDGAIWLYDRNRPISSEV